ncbi:MAG TPA: AsmA-like C-terminal region-containing protein, partial [Wenzhouxiangella sp.]
RLSGWLAAEPNDTEQVQFRVLMEQQEARWVRAEAWLNAREISLDYWLNQVGLSEIIDIETRLSLEAWLRWDEQSGGRVDSSWQLSGPHGRLQGDVAAERWPIGDEQNNERAWAVEVFDLAFNDEPVLSSVAWAKNSEDQGVWAQWIDLGSLHQALDPWLSVDARWPSAVSGRLSEVALVADLDHRTHAAAGKIENVAVALNQPQFSLSGFTGVVGPAGDQLALELTGQPGLSWPEVMPGEIRIDQMEGRVLFAPDQIGFENIKIESAAVSAELNGSIYQARGRPFLDLLIEASRIDGVDVRPYLPRAVIPPPAMGWLEQALIWIGQADGLALLHFPVGLKTAEFDAGHLSAEVNFSGLDLNYLNDWPIATDVTGQALFLGAGMRAEVQGAQVGELTLQAPAIEIERFNEAVLMLDLVGESVEAQALSSTLGALPFKGWSEVFDAMAWTGEIEAAVGLEVPLKKREEWSLEGLVSFAGNGFSLPNIDFSISDLTGEIDIDRDAIRGEQLSASLGSQSLNFDAQIGLGEGAQVAVATRLNPGQWLSESGLDIGFADRLDGQADVLVEVTRWPSNQALSVEVTSDLVGLEMDLPAPLTKTSELAWPLKVQWLGHADASQWQVALNEQWAIALQPHESAWSVAIGTDPQRFPIPPMAPGFEFSGQLTELDVGAWQRLIGSTNPSVEQSPAALGQWVSQVFEDRVWVDIAVERLLLPGVVPGQATIGLELTDERWVFDVTGERIQGEVSVPTLAQSRQALVVDLEHLYLLTSETDSETEDSPVSPPNLTDPREATPLTLLIESLFWGDLALGATRVETHLANEGLEIELIDIDGPDLRLQARGRWVNIADGTPESVMTGRLSSRNFNKLIRATGYQAGLQARQATLDFDLNWPGTPLDFSLFRLEGGLDFILRGGNIPQASAGAGRLLGLVSFSALPRRLMLDFRDVFSSGFQFDGIEGRFDMRDGQATTEGIKIASPAAVITLTGTTDMIARSYDQSVVVEPGLGSTLPVIGGLAGGPVGAAAGLLLQSLFDQPLKGVSEARYSITGPWSEPVIELVDARIAPDTDIDTEPDNGSGDGERDDGEMEGDDLDESSQKPSSSERSSPEQPSPEPPPMR